MSGAYMVKYMILIMKVCIRRTNEKTALGKPKKKKDVKEPRTKLGILILLATGTFNFSKHPIYKISFEKYTIETKCSINQDRTVDFFTKVYLTCLYSVYIT